MNIVQLSKKFRLVWSVKNEVIVNGEFESNSVTGAVKERSFQSDLKEDVENKISELGLVINKENV